MENETKNSRERLEIQGRYNLAMGIQLVREDFEREIDETARDESIPSMTPEQVENFFSAVHAGQARQSAQKRRRVFYKRFARLGAVAAVLVILVPAIAMNASASRTAISNFVIQNFADHSVLRYDKENNALPPFGWRSEYYPRWLPEGYYISSVNFDHPSDYIWYNTKTGKQLSFFVFKSLPQPSLNNENREKKSIMIGEYPAVLYTSVDMREIMLFLPLPNGTVQIEGNLSENEIVQIAESFVI